LRTWQPEHELEALEVDLPDFLLNEIADALRNDLVEMPDEIAAIPGIMPALQLGGDALA
jgi:hypothetical protein